jgi:hypothetical protein
MAVTGWTRHSVPVHRRVGELVASIDALIARAAAAGVDQATAREINDMLSTGYAHALASEGHVRRLERRIQDLMERGDRERASRELDALVVQRRDTTAQATHLRARLEQLAFHFHGRLEPH